MNSRLLTARRRLKTDLSKTDRIYVEVCLYHPQTDDDASRLDDYKLLEDEGWVVLHDQVDLRSIAAQDADGRLTLNARNYRVTSVGIQGTTGAWKKAFFNVLNNIPTLIAAVVLAVAVDWALSLFGPSDDKSRMPETNQAMEQN